ncbi:ribonuclease toxin immunity protein CdiI [Psychrobacillus sp. FSL W7-1457]|uniref:ribonuclease toxin immunity protein CdiI n=1 Tax=Psychrobacillus sp. FSL W7-1457 TaxID=2954547 RepID=UPI00315AD74D
MEKINEEIMLEKDHYVVIAFFNAISDTDFVRTVEQMSLGIGTGINVVDCSFPNDLEDDEEKFEGVMFSLHNEELLLSYSEFFYYLNLASELYISDFPNSREILEVYLDKIAKNYDL